MRIDHRSLDILVSQEFLHGPDIVALLQQLRGEAVSEGMATDALVEPHRTPCLTYSLLQTTLTHVMATDAHCPWVFRQTIRGKDILPDPQSAGMRILPFQRKR